VVTMLTCAGCNSRWFTLAEIATLYSVTASTVRYWRIQDKFPNAQAIHSTGRGHIWLVPETDLERFTPPGH